MSSCFLLTTKSVSIQDIYDTLMQFAMISKYAGGIVQRGTSHVGETLRSADATMQERFDKLCSWYANEKVPRLAQ